MLRLTLDMIPFGIESRKRNISTIEVWNMGNTYIDIEQDGTVGYSYGARTVDKDGNKTDYGIVVTNFDRMQKAHKLIFLVCMELEKKGAF